MREGMSYSITWKYRQVMIMAQKKDRSRFTIKFRESDPAHNMTIRILERQGQRNIAPFLVNAVLHYVQCTETPDVSHMLTDNSATMVDRNAIEEIVWGILSRQGIFREDVQRDDEINSNTDIILEEKRELNIEEDISVDSLSSQNVVNEEVRAMIKRTLSAFRRD